MSPEVFESIDVIDVPSLKSDVVYHPLKIDPLAVGSFNVTPIPKVYESGFDL